MVGVATGALVVDSLLLVVAWAYTQRIILLAGAASSALGAVLVLWSWRRQRRRLVEIDEARQALRDEAVALRELTRG